MSQTNSYTSTISNLEIEIGSVDMEAINDIKFEKPHLKISENSLLLNVFNVARFYAENGNRIVISPAENIDRESVNLFLHGSALGAILLQRKILSLHGSSFSFHGKGVTICGHAGAGKSSVTAAFCKDGAKLITDDISPIVLKDNVSYIHPLKTSLKLWDDALKQLEFNADELTMIRPSINKFYFENVERLNAEHPLNTVVFLHTHNKVDFQHSVLTGIDKFNALRNNIYRKIYLKGMPAAEKQIYQQLIATGNSVQALQVLRPKACSIAATKDYIENLIFDKIVPVE